MRDGEIRAVDPADHDAIDGVVDAAFGAHGPAVVTMVRAIRKGEFARPDYEIVAVRDGAVIGHTCVSGTPLRRPDGIAQTVLMLSPLAVRPDQQRHGVGSALVRAVLSRVQADGHPMVVLEGDPAFYGPLGFDAAAGHGIVIQLPDWAPPEAAQVAVLGSPVTSGTVEYPAYVPVD